MLDVFLLFSLLALESVSAAESWTVRVEEPTGLYPRTNEVVEVPYEKLGGKGEAWTVTDQQGAELPWQATEHGLLFPATLIPGELPEYQVTAANTAGTNFVNEIRLRVLGLNRLELGNRLFRILIDKQAGAIVEAFNLSADPHRTLNLVELTPEDAGSWKKEGRTPEQMGFQPVPGVPEGNPGWTSLGGSGPITRIDLVESGPLRGRVRLVRADDVLGVELDCPKPRIAMAGQARIPLHRHFRFSLPALRPICGWLRVPNGPLGPTRTSHPTTTSA